MAEEWLTSWNRLAYGFELSPGLEGAAFWVIGGPELRKGRWRGAALPLSGGRAQSNGQGPGPKPRELMAAMRLDGLQAAVRAGPAGSRWCWCLFWTLDLGFMVYGFYL